MFTCDTTDQVQVSRTPEPQNSSKKKTENSLTKKTKMTKKTRNYKFSSTFRHFSVFFEFFCQEISGRAPRTSVSVSSRIFFSVLGFLIPVACRACRNSKVYAVIRRNTQKGAKERKRKSAKGVAGAERSEKTENESKTRKICHNTKYP